MDYKVRINIEPENSKLECEANINMGEFKKDIPRIIERDKDFIAIVAKAILASRLLPGDAVKRALSYVRNDFTLIAESRDNVFHYKREGSYRDSIVCLSIIFAMQKSLRGIFTDLIEDHVPDICPCDDCVERRKSGEDSPENIKHVMEDLIEQFKNKDKSGG